MMMRIPLGSQRKAIVGMIIFTVLLSLDGYMIRPAWGSESLVFSINVTNEQIGNVLRTISNQTGYNFLINESVKNTRITVSLSKVPLDKGLEWIFRAAGVGSHAIIYADNRIIEIRLFDGLSLASYGRGKHLDSPPSSSHRLERVSGMRQPQNEEMGPPPDLPEYQGTHTEELQAREDRNKSIQLLQADDYIPPDE